MQVWGVEDNAIMIMLVIMIYREAPHSVPIQAVRITLLPDKLVDHSHTSRFVGIQVLGVEDNATNQVQVALSL
jgi:hypothetical protein